MQIKHSAAELAAQTAEDIKLGKYGASGDLFPPLREFSEAVGVSYVTAQRAVMRLRGRGLLMLCGNRIYITCGIPRRSSALSRYLREHRLKSTLIGMYINNLKNTFFTAVSHELTRELCQKGYELIVMGGDGTAERERAVLESFVGMGVRAVVSCPGFGGDIAEVYRNYILPTVFIGRTPEGLAGASAVLVNNVNAGRQVAAHLLESGSLEFAYIGEARLADGEDMRLEGFRRGLAAQDMALNEANVLTVEHDAFALHASAVRQLIMRSPKPLGIFCYHDMLAVSVMNMCEKEKIKIPEQVKVVGFDSLPVAEFVTPALTSVSYRFDRMAREAANELIRLIADPSCAAGSIYVKQALIVRGSTR